MSIILLLLLLLPGFSLLYNTSQYTAGNNLISNFDFSLPLLASNQASLFYYNIMPSWECLPTRCQQVHMQRRCTVWGVACNTSFFQAIEIDATASVDSYVQNITLEHSGLYELQIAWMPSFYLPINKNMLIEINSTQIGKIVVTDSLMQDHIYEVLVNLTAGPAVFALVQETASDTYGSHIGNVTLKYLAPVEPISTPMIQISELLGSPLSYFTNIFLQNVTENVNLFPGSRIFTYSLTNFLLTFDRLQFYYFHNQNLTYSSYVLLHNANKMGLERGSLTQKLMESSDNQFCVGVTTFYSNMVNALDHKYDYTEPYLLAKNQNGMGFFANNLDFFFYQLPLILLTYGLLLLLFRLLFNYRISKCIRKYAFYGILLMIIYQGNVEQFTFFFFNECRNFFSLNIQHKMANIFLLYFFFMMLVFSIGGLLFFTFNYRKLVKYFLEDSETANIQAAVLESLERSTFPMIFGAVHALFLDWLWLQTIILFMVQLCYLTVKMLTLRSVTPRYKFKVMMCAFSSLLRLCFIATFYIYQQNNSPSIMEDVHSNVVMLYLLCWLIEFLHDCVLMLGDIKDAVCGFCKKKEENEMEKEGINLKDSVMKKRKIRSYSKLRKGVQQKQQAAKLQRIIQNNIFQVKEHKRSQASINDAQRQASIKYTTTFKQKKAKSHNPGKKAFKSEKGIDQGSKRGSLGTDKGRQMTIMPLKTKESQTLQSKTITIKSQKQIRKIPNLIIQSVHEEGLFPSTKKC